MNKNKINIVGAFDRYNYGDLLFPYVIEYFFKKYFDNAQYELEYYGIRGYKDEKSGVKKTKPISKMDQNAIIINAGGNTLNARIRYLYADNIENKLKYKIFNFLLLIFGEKKIENILLKKLKLNMNYPYCISSEKMIYNSVGGVIEDSIKQQGIFDYGFKVGYLSVRDKETAESVRRFDPKIVPDSAIILSDMWDEEKLIRYCNKKIKEKIKEHYIVFQISKNMFKKNKTDILRFIKYCILQNFKIWLLPIGKAISHGDCDALNEIYNLYKGKVFYDKNINIFETTLVLKHAMLFIGSSLHGNLISFSYNVPSVLIANQNTKNKSYYDTWLTSTSCKCISLKEMNQCCNIIDDLDTLFKENNHELIRQKNLVYSNWKKMAEFIQKQTKK